ncbi:MAG: GNAT family N-acetyltransferase [Bradyrhizobiaceae bacterium]|nr:GNAT family N-acetyltransferase [Bradyrhizobiaceae bacterium]
MQQRPKPALPAAPSSAAIRDEYIRLAPGQMATVITHLEMHAPPRLRPEPAGHAFEIHHARNPDLDWYRDLYRRVGENWLWFSRLLLDDRALAALIRRPEIEVHVLRAGSRDEGILELDFRRLPDVEISFLGVTQNYIGTGAGRFLMNRALELSWARSPRRVTVHTCTLDHPNALAFYLRSGFRPYARSVEIADDPRVHGILPLTVAPHFPIVK